MESFLQLAKEGSTGVAIALIVAFVIIAKIVLNMIEKSVSSFITEYKKQNEKQSKVIKSNTTATRKGNKLQDETLRYLKNKNGQMEECFTKVMDNQGKQGKVIEKVANKLDNIDSRYIKSRSE